ncbi:MAG TPA: ATPase, T2SS/T4P/T4SS family, partial [Clostridia bacterium]
LGEIRDGETAEIAVRAALTGHLVLSTMHTNNSVASIARLADMGIENFLLSSSLIGIIAQRLVRKICTHCRKAYKADEKDKKLLEIPHDEDLVLYKADGCDYCGKTGYKGRVGVFEIFNVNDKIRKAIDEGTPADMLQQMAVQSGMRTLSDDARKKVIDGITTLDEYIKITFSI